MEAETGWNGGGEMSKNKIEIADIPEPRITIDLPVEGSWEDRPPITVATLPSVNERILWNNVEFLKREIEALKSFIANRNR